MVGFMTTPMVMIVIHHVFVFPQDATTHSTFPYPCDPEKCWYIVVENKYQNASDAELVLLVQSGRNEAFDEIDRRYRVILNRFLLRHLCGSEYAEELSQQTLVKGYMMINQLQSGEKLSGWLHRIAFRLIMAQGRQRRVVTLENSDQWDSLFPAASDNGKDEPNNIWHILEKELSSEEFRILCLKYREDLSIAQIAQIIDKKETAVRVQLHRIRKKLYVRFRRSEL